MLLLLLIGPALAQPPAACQGPCITPFGVELGRFGSLPAHSNCSVECVDPTPIMTPHTGQPDGVYTGIGWQCVEFARRAWLERHGRVFGSVDTAAEMWSAIRSISRPDGGDTLPVSAHPNGGDEPPVEGDLIIYAADPSTRALRFGHVALVVGIEKGEVRLAEQNWSNNVWANAGFSRSLELAATTRLSDPPATILGWLRVKTEASSANLKHDVKQK